MSPVLFCSKKIEYNDRGVNARNRYAIRAEERCLKCHSNSFAGEVLGVLKIRQDMGPALHAARKKFALFFLLLSPVPLLMASLAARFLNARIHRSTTLLHDKVKGINSMRDLTKLEMADIDLGFSDLNRILLELGEFVHRMKNVAVDKEMLEFEIRVLEKFIITSEVVRDWKEYVGQLLVEINKVIRAYTLFSLFQVDEEVYDMEIFWIHKPSPATVESVEAIVRNQVRKERTLLKDVADLKITHTIVDPSLPLPELKARDLEMQTKSLILETPQIGGVVGIGVQSEITRDPIRSLVIDSILTTLLNVVGSIKAIYKYTKELEYYATRDPPTNLYNQRIFWELLGYEVSRAKRHGYKFAVLVIDVDNFKYINDTHGHVVGDRFLAKFAQEVKAALRHGDILARYGGDEFAVVLPEAGEEQAYMVAQRMKDSVDSMSLTTAQGSSVKASISVGLAIYPDHADTTKDLFLLADNMAYKSKSEGKNRISAPTGNDVVEIFRERGEKTREIMDAIERKEVVPYFQPIMNISTGRIECHEVLGRIVTEKGILSAGEFIELAEKLGIVNKLDHLLMEKVFRKVKEEEYGGALFINLSPKSLILKDFIPEVLKLTRQYGIEHGRIVFELTERETVKNISLLEKFVHDLKLEGFKFAIDDFGSGFSTFHCLKRFPVDFIKIEGDFVRNMLTDARDRAFVKTISMLAREFGIISIAKYVEEERIVASAARAGIDYAQGYYIGMPSPEFRKEK